MYNKLYCFHRTSIPIYLYNRPYCHCLLINQIIDNYNNQIQSLRVLENSKRCVDKNVEVNSKRWVNPMITECLKYLTV